jgi:hypothetical protein
MSIRDRFSSKYCVDPASGCWIWTASVRRSPTRPNWPGNGIFRTTKAEDGGRQLLLAHRVSYELHRGPIPKGALVCHHCDNPLCVNPDHLFLGSQTDNMRDAIAKGRFICGEKHKNAKLTEATAREIVAALRHAGRRDHAKIARKYGVTPTIIYLIRDNKIWKHIPRD